MRADHRRLESAAREATDGQATTPEVGAGCADYPRPWGKIGWQPCGGKSPTKTTSARQQCKLRAVLCSSLLLKHIPQLQRSEGREHRAVAQRG
jgi:hypothetical protein